MKVCEVGEGYILKSSQLEIKWIFTIFALILFFFSYQEDTVWVDFEQPALTYFPKVFLFKSLLLKTFNP